MNKSCELCKSPAKIYCDSDQASLCWTCDHKVHSANFLVARHPRILLCRCCQSLTPWTATGEKLWPSAVSVCHKCFLDGNRNDNNNNINDEDDDDVYDEDDETELDVEDEEDNQVVPLSSYTSPPVASCSSSDGYSCDRGVVSSKRKRVNQADLSQDDVDCLSAQKNNRLVYADDSNEAKAMLRNRGKLYHFIPLNSEGMGCHRDRISSENKSKAVASECKPTRTVGLDLNSSDL